MWGPLPGLAVVAGLLAGYLVVAAPIAGLLTRHELRRSPAQASPRLLVYRRVIGRQWLLAGTALAIVGLAGLPAASVGLRPPQLATRTHSESIPLAAMLLAAALLMARRRPGHAGQEQLLPITGDERRLYVVVAVTAGAAEELLFRGFLLLYLTGSWGWSWQQAALASSLAFGLSHVCQGFPMTVAGMLMGYGLAQLYLATGSLLAPALVHAAVDLRVLAWPRRPDGNQKCSGASAASSRSPVWNTCGAAVSTPSPATSSSVGSVVDA
jgi:uncharacterized protein